MARQDILQNQIESLCKSIPELSGALLASNEGLPIASLLTNNVDPNWLAVIAATGASLGRRMDETMGIGALAEMSFGCAAAKLFLYSAGSQAVLAVVGSPETDAGFIQIEATNVANGVGEILGNKTGSALAEPIP